MLHRISLALSSVFYIGFLPGAPGTYGSLATVAALYLVGLCRDALETGWGFLAAACAVAIIGILTAHVASRKAGKEDPSFVVIDEVAGQMLTFFLVPLGGGLGLVNLALGFFAFRAFDIWKPWPIRKLEALPGGVGIVADDLLAGVYSCVALHLADAFFRFMGWSFAG